MTLAGWIWVLVGMVAGQLLRLAVWYAIPALSDWRSRRRARRSPATTSTLASVAAMYQQMYAPESVRARPAPMLHVIRKARYPMVEPTGNETWVSAPADIPSSDPPDGDG